MDKTDSKIAKLQTQKSVLEELRDRLKVFNWKHDYGATFRGTHWPNENTYIKLYVILNNPDVNTTPSWQSSLKGIDSDRVVDHLDDPSTDITLKVTGRVHVQHPFEEKNTSTSHKNTLDDALGEVLDNIPNVLDDIEDTISEVQNNIELVRDCVQDVR